MTPTQIDSLFRRYRLHQRDAITRWQRLMQVVHCKPTEDMPEELKTWVLAQQKSFERFEDNSDEYFDFMVKCIDKYYEEHGHLPGEGPEESM